MLDDCLQDPQLDRSLVYGVLSEFQSVVNDRFGARLDYAVIEEFRDMVSPLTPLVRRIDQVLVGEYGNRRFAHMVSELGIGLPDWFELV